MKPINLGQCEVTMHFDPGFVPPTKFHAGDVVQLKSGGPKMTVGEMAGSYVECLWHSADDEAQSEYFPPAALKFTA